MSSKLNMVMQLDIKQVLERLKRVDSKIKDVFGIVSKPLKLNADGSEVEQALDNISAKVDGIEDIEIDADGSDAVDEAGEVAGAMDEIPDNKNIKINTEGTENSVQELTRVGVAIFAISNSYNMVKSKIAGYLELSNRQELSEVSLTSALKARGLASQQNIDSMIKLAQRTQAVTMIGDEASIEMLALATSSGVAFDKMEETLTGAIGLSTAFEKAGLSQEMAMKGLALAYEGEFTQLNRYIPALRTATTDTEKMAILQEAMANGFEMAKDQAKSQAGQLAQTGNLLSDLGDKIGDVLKSYLKPLNVVLKGIAQWLNDYPSLFRGLVAAFTAMVTVTSLLLSKTIALNAAKAVGAALSGNWIALAAAAAVGVGAWAASSSALKGNIDELNESVEEATNSTQQYQNQLDRMNTQQVKSAVTDLKQEYEDLKLELEELKKHDPGRTLSDNHERLEKAIYEAKKKYRVARSKLIVLENKDEQSRLEIQEDFVLRKTELDNQASLSNERLLERQLELARLSYEDMKVVDQQTMNAKLGQYQKIMDLEKQLKAFREQEDATELAEQAQKLSQSKAEIVEYYSNLKELGIINYEEMKNKLQEYLEKVKSVYGEESEIYKEEKKEITRLEQNTNLRMYEDRISLQLKVHTELLEADGKYHESKLLLFEASWEKEKAALIAAKVSEEEIEKLYAERKLAITSKMTKAQSQAYNVFHAGIMEMFGDIARIEVETNNTLIKGFVAMANTFIAQVQRMIAQWLAFQAVKKLGATLGFNILGSVLGFGNGGQVPIMADGGLLYGASHSEGGIPLVAEGGEYIINTSSTAMFKPLLDLINFAPKVAMDMFKGLSGFRIPTASSYNLAYSGANGAGMEELVGEVRALRAEVRNKQISGVFSMRDDRSSYNRYKCFLVDKKSYEEQAK